MGVPQAVAEYLADLKSLIKRVRAEDHTELIVAVRHCAETFRRYMAVGGAQSIAIDDVVSKCSILVEVMKANPDESEATLRPYRRAAIHSVEDLSRILLDAAPSNEAVILQLPRR
jgi:putative NADH-flavin reductase